MYLWFFGHWQGLAEKVRRYITVSPPTFISYLSPPPLQHPGQLSSGWCGQMMNLLCGLFLPFTHFKEILHLSFSRQMFLASEKEIFKKVHMLTQWFIYCIKVLWNVQGSINNRTICNNDMILYGGLRVGGQPSKYDRLTAGSIDNFFLLPPVV